MVTGPELLAEQRPAGAVRTAAIRALTRLGFRAEEEQPTAIVAIRDRGGYIARVQVTYSPTQYEVVLLEDHGYEPPQLDPDTGEQVHDRQLVSLLTKTRALIRRELVNIDQAEAASLEAERNHQLRLAAESAPRTTVVQQSAPQPQRQINVGGLIQGAAQLLPQVNVQHSVDVQRSDQSFDCCINGAYYSCPGQAAFQQCMSSGPSACSRDSSRDGTCR